MMKRMALILAVAVFLPGANPASAAQTGREAPSKRQFPEWFYTQEPIRIIDKSMVMLGNTDNPLITISLIDLIYNHGHMCNGVAVGYRAIKEASRRLFGRQLPQRGEMRIVSSVNSCPADLFAHVFGVRDHYGNRAQFGTLITPDHCDRNNDMRFIFQRVKKEAGRVKALKTVQIELIKGTIPAEFYKLLKIVKSKMATPGDRQRLKQLSRKTYTKIMLAETDEIFIIKELPDYHFPVVEECNK
jgi:acetolactate decarboxylase